MNIVLLVSVHIVTGISTAGINHIGLKLAPKESAIVYLTCKNIITSIFSSIAPIHACRFLYASFIGNSGYLEE
ncbi:hypothetical protein [Ohtaekwangia koreensis]|uniref:hypothetical protein n=1 Tax=Ohtaekwangia koreensis TaxID=688867 RepID=UPI0011807640|nr:hypothetical protein [Ohtaekwangia koreensis]